MVRYEGLPRPLSVDTLFSQLEEERRGGKVGYYSLPESSRGLVEELKGEEFTFTTIVHIGIGGSSLGPKALSALFRERLSKEIVFLENPDPVDLGGKLEGIDPQSSLFLVVSKSGTTIETLTIFKILLKTLDLQLEGAPNIWTITEEGSPLDRFAATYGLRSFHIPKEVGGRFSVLSSVGIVPLTLAGLDTLHLLEGAGEFRDRFFRREEDHLLHKALFYSLNARRYPINVLFSYASELEEFTKWYVQLWGESLGKRRGGEGVGLTPVGLLGTIDQHSFLQLLIEGPRDKTVTFLKVGHFNTDLEIPDLHLPHLDRSDFVNGSTLSTLLNRECDATREALTRSQVPNDLIEIERIEERAVGELIFYFELLTSATALALGIDAYNQPGVELGKRILRESFL
ncbi:MAG: glucose-6-phosphate isomerase [Epsilonproteobacteria bacterium]|nr:glucose-6-phosphate isomerase [Campylobacterota bacterium]NPA57631.1 glucose-6-phosphate isomerase [Campylobacterota bacterium]